MSENLEIFVFMGKKVRVVNRDGVVWFVANDVGKVLGLANVRDTIRKVLHVSEWTYVEKRYSVKIPVEKIYTSRVRSVKLVAINESGLYTLIMRSTKPEAKAFRQWVTNEVLPSLRKTGSYTMRPVMQEAAPEVIGEAPKSGLTVKLTITGDMLSVMELMKKLQ